MPDVLKHEDTGRWEDATKRLKKPHLFFRYFSPEGNEAVISPDLKIDSFKAEIGQLMWDGTKKEDLLSDLEKLSRSYTISDEEKAKFSRLIDEAWIDFKQVKKDAEKAFV